jgi:hypothetical protein
MNTSRILPWAVPLLVFGCGPEQVVLGSPDFDDLPQTDAQSDGGSEGAVGEPYDAQHADAPTNVGMCRCRDAMPGCTGACEDDD